MESKLSLGFGSWEPPASHRELLDNLHRRKDDIAKLLSHVNDPWVCDDLVYRFWHHSFKAYALQEISASIAAELKNLAPQGTSLHPWFTEILAAGTGEVFALEHNKDWLRNVGPIVAAFFHTRHLLQLAHDCATSLHEPPSLLPSNWATLLELYQIR